MSVGFDPGLGESRDCWLSLGVLSFKAILFFRSILAEVGKSQTDLAFTLLVKMIQNKYIFNSFPYALSSWKVRQDIHTIAK